MKRKPVRIILTFICLLAAFVVAESRPVRAQSGLEVTALRVGAHPDKTRLVVELSESSPYRAFMLYDPPRLVIDLPDFRWSAPAVTNSKSTLFKSVRHGSLQPGISRIVVDLAKPATLQTAFLLPKGPSLPDRIVIDFASAGSDHNPAKERMFGALRSEMTGNNPLPSKQDTSPQPTRAAPALVPPAPVSENSKKPIIVIDPGHGGQDPGAIGANGKKEKDVTLAMARELKTILETSGRYRVHLTRDSDVFIKLQERVAIARRKNADLFISIHADSIDKAGVSGASVYTLSNKASDAQTAKLAARENRADLIAGVDLSHEDKDVANILIDLAMRDTMNQSKFFANTVVGEAKSKGIRLLERPHRYAGFAVLKAPDVPSILIEVGFMSNRDEVDRLSTPAYRKKIATAIARGVGAYFDRIKNP